MHCSLGSSSRRSIGVFLVVAGLAVLLGGGIAFAAVGDEDVGTIVLTRIGKPVWKPAGFHVFTAPIGTPEDGYAGFNQTMSALLPPPNHAWCNDLGIGPGVPHDPPYTKEFGKSLEALDYREAVVFHPPDFTPPNGVWAVWMVVPVPSVKGSSPEFGDGPIIPNSLFPIHVVGQTYRNDQLWNPYLGDYSVPPLTTALSCPFDVDGYSHFPAFNADTSSFGPGGPIAGNYEYRFTMMDTAGNGWSITVNFKIGAGKETN